MLYATRSNFYVLINGALIGIYLHFCSVECWCRDLMTSLYVYIKLTVHSLTYNVLGF